MTLMALAILAEGTPSYGGCAVSMRSDITRLVNKRLARKQLNVKFFKAFYFDNLHSQHQSIRLGS